MSDLRYALYLRPSYKMCRAQAEVHDLLRRQYGLQAAGRFMPHATIKGFFRSEASVEGIAARFDAALAGRRAFEVFSGGVTVFGREAIALDVHAGPDGSPNTPLLELHRAAMEAALSLVDPSCEFTREELEFTKERFPAHLTLAMADIPARFFDEVLGFVHQAEPIGPPSFLADTLHMFAFRSDEWGGRWWETLRWELLRSWRLASRR